MFGGLGRSGVQSVCFSVVFSTAIAGFSAASFAQDASSAQDKPAQAAAPIDQPEPEADGDCERKNTDPVKPLNFDMTNDVTGRGLFEALVMGLDPVEFPFKEIAEAKAPCKRGGFKLGRGNFTIYGSDYGTPPRWAASPEFSDYIVYLVLMPTPQVAYDAVMKKEAAKKKEKPTPVKGKAAGEPKTDASAETEEAFRFEKGATMMHALTIADKKANRMVFAFFEGIPDDIDLARYMCRALAGQYSIQATLNLENGKYGWGKKVESLSESLDEKDIGRMACQLSQ